MNNRRTVAFVYCTNKQGWLRQDGFFSPEFSKAKVYHKVGHAKTAIRARDFEETSIIVPLEIEFDEKELFFRILGGK